MENLSEKRGARRPLDKGTFSKKEKQTQHGARGFDDHQAYGIGKRKKILEYQSFQTEPQSKKQL